MKISIVKAEFAHLDDCCSAVQDSDLGRTYFSEREKLISAICEGISKGELYVAATEENGCAGFLWFMLNGAFHSFPYLHIIAVKSQYRGLGIGSKMLKYFENTSLADKKRPIKLFLLVADFNPEAKRLYEKTGYKQIAVIKDLYKKGVDECLMVKEIF